MLEGEENVAYNVITQAIGTAVGTADPRAHYGLQVFGHDQGTAWVEKVVVPLWCHYLGAQTKLQYRTMKV